MERWNSIFIPTLRMKTWTTCVNAILKIRPDIKGKSEKLEEKNCKKTNWKKKDVERNDQGVDQKKNTFFPT